MEHFALLSLSLLACFLILVAFSGPSGLINRAFRCITNESNVRPESATDKGRHSRIFIPKMLARWPWQRRINPNFAVVKKETDAWITSLQAFSPKVQDVFNRCSSALLVCLAFPAASKEHVRAICDYTTLLFLIDEQSDWSTPSEVRKQKGAVMDAFQNPHKPRPKNEWICGEAARQFWERTTRIATAVSQKRLIRYMDEYLDAVVQEAIYRKSGRVLDVKSYINVRRLSSAVKASFTMIELGLDIPDEVMAHPAMQEVIIAGTDLVSFSNDILSYNIERRRGDDLYNLVTCAMHEYHTDVNGAISWIADYLTGAEERFRAGMAALPQWEEPLNSQVKEYCDGIGQCVRANDDWSFESERYFGNKGPEIKQSRWMSLLPKKRAVEMGPMPVDGSLL